MHVSTSSPASGLTNTVLHDAASTQRWLAAQTGEATTLLAAIHDQLVALTQSTLPTAQACSVLETLWQASVEPAAHLEARYRRKPLPLPDNDYQAFAVTRRLWLAFADAHLQLAQRLNKEEAAIMLQRAANALRLAANCHFVAACEYDRKIDTALFSLLQTAGQRELLIQRDVDPAFAALGEGSCGGYLAWTLLLRCIDPMRFTSAQLDVLLRLLSRWRELCSWQSGRSDDPKARVIDLSRFSPQPLPAGTPCWLDIRAVVRKLRQRSDALRAGETPESLKLGNELSATACLRLFKEIELALAGILPAAPNDNGDIDLAFGADDSYAVCTGQRLNPRASDKRSSAVAHQRLGIFGFDQISRLPNDPRQIDIAGERWQQQSGQASRPAGQTPVRHLAPCLIATQTPDGPRLGILRRLEMRTDGSLCGHLHWFAERVEAGLLPRAPQNPQVPRQALFLLHSPSGDKQLLLPPSIALRLGSPFSIESATLTQVVPQEVLERGSDFVRYRLQSL